MGNQKKGLKLLENSATALWLAMDILWSYDLVFIASIVGGVSAILQYIHVMKQKDKLETLESGASFFWVGANLLWLLELDVAKTFYFSIACVVTILVFINHGKLKRGT